MTSTSKNKPKPKKEWCQCLLVRDCGSTSILRQVAFLPVKHARVGNVVKLRTRGKWEDGWKVVTAGKLLDHRPDYRKMIRHHRHETGDDDKWTD